MKLSTITSITLFAAAAVVGATNAPRQYGYGYGDPTTNAPTATGTAASQATGAAGGAYGGGASVPQGGAAAFVLSPHSAVLAHAVCGALATMLFLPSGVLAARVMRGLSPSRTWFAIHAVVQGVVGLGLVLAAAAIGWAKFSSKKIDTPHRKAAVALFALVWLQALLGAATHALGARRGGRGVANVVHWTLGLATIGLGWAVAWLGFTSEWSYRGHGAVSGKWKIGWGVVVGLWVLAYVAGLGLLPRQLKRERATDEVARVARLDSDKDMREAPLMG
ncbi:hypothetical protein Q8F55_008522 [Vanrija albida]|uniref:Cytochrome b561 domain-containing protein n=1 Tax=Vanrija albida TaxID=181172 RepID=A0ABR3PR37_9TREE